MSDLVTLRFDLQRTRDAIERSIHEHAQLLRMIDTNIIRVAQLVAREQANANHV